MPPNGSNVPKTFVVCEAELFADHRQHKKLWYKFFRLAAPDQSMSIASKGGRRDLRSHLGILYCIQQLQFCENMWMPAGEGSLVWILERLSDLCVEVHTSLQV